MDPISKRLAERFAAMRQDKGWSLDELARHSGLSRSTLSRLEKQEVSPTAESLGKLCATFGLPLSQLMMQVEKSFQPLVTEAEQTVWRDPQTGFLRRVASPPSQTLGAEVIDARLPAHQDIAYPGPTRPGMEHHLYLLSGTLKVEANGQAHALKPGDCLRYHLNGPSCYTTQDTEAHYILVLL